MAADPVGSKHRREAVLLATSNRGLFRKGFSQNDDFYPSVLVRPSGVSFSWQPVSNQQNPVADRWVMGTSVQL